MQAIKFLVECKISVVISMKVVLVSNSDLEGGAARAASRLYQGLHLNEVSASMIVQIKYGTNSTVIGSKASSGKGKIISGSRLILDQLPLKLIRNHVKTNFSTQWLPEDIVPRISRISPDIVNLHWINNGFVKIESLAKFNRPIVWTLHDMWAFTGGCHYSQNCNHFQKMCGSCPQLSSGRDKDLSRWIWYRKTKAWQDLNLTVVSPSSWLANCAKNSSIFSNTRIECIPNGIDTNLYKPHDKQFARDVLGLPQDKCLLLFGALSATSDTRKGFHLLKPALKFLHNSMETGKVELVIFGASKPINSPGLPFKTHYLGILKDDISLALAYSAADVFVLPSVQENLPNTILEAIACGLPCVAFNIGGIPDIIKHQQNGFLAKPYSCENLAEGISWVLHDKNIYHFLSTKAREIAEERFTLSRQANCYKSLFQEIIFNKP